MPEAPIFPLRDPLVIDPGELKHFVHILRASQQGDSFGKSVNPAEWDEVLTTWAALYTAGGRETAMASHLVSAVSHVAKIRFSPVITMRANYRIVKGSRYFTVEHVENVKEKDFVLLLYCIEIDSGGV